MECIYSQLRRKIEPRPDETHHSLAGPWLGSRFTLSEQSL